MITNIKNFLKANYLYGLLLIALFIAVAVAVHYYRKSQLPGQIIAANKILKNPNVAPIDTFRDSLGDEHSEIPANTNQIAQAALKDPGVKRDSVIKSVDDALNLADAQHLMEVTQENINLRARVLKLTRDSANLAMLVYNDKYLHFNYDPRDSTVRNLTYNFKLSQVKYGKQKLFSNTPVIDFYPDDPRVTLSGFTHFSVTPPVPIFGLTADARAMYDFNYQHVTPSVGLNFRINNFYLEGRNYYSFKNDRFQQQVGFGYKQTIF